jgi:uncharacterized oxidoreductase
VNIGHQALKELSSRIFSAIGCDGAEAEVISRLLVTANLVGHDSHGVARIPRYVDYWRQGEVLPNQKATITFENQQIVIFDGNKGFGQSIGVEVVSAGIDKARQNGVALVGVGNVGHLGRIGDWAEMAIAAGQTSLHFVNTSGAGMSVAPFGGIESRYATNPISIGMPNDAGESLIFDAATSMLAEGKIIVAKNKGVELPEGALTGADGTPTRDPNALYTPPHAVMNAMGEHKGGGLAIMADLLAGALGGGGCARPGVTAVYNGMLSILIDPAVFADRTFVGNETARFADWVRSARPVDPDKPVLLPGDPERNTRRDREQNGIVLDDTTWGQITDTAASLDLTV